MAIRTPEHPDGFGPTPVSPWTQTWRDWTTTPGVEHVITVTIPYDNDTKALLGPVATYRDPPCRWTQLLINPPTGTLVPVDEGDGTFDLALLPVATVTDLEIAGYTVV